jgi:DNA-binding NtrC family response regulator
LVITDIRMPRLNGIEILKWIKKRRRKEKIIVITGNPSDLSLSAPDMPSVVTQLKKPFMVESLFDMVVAAMSCVDEYPKWGQDRLQ